MVGTFYRAPSPDADSYSEVGMKIGPESIVCILEAMKVMNEIKAECSGEIVRICVQNAEAVEYGQALFIVKTG
jgi:acetyl-CoA carboxylase biotin carboxyl carrier protein